MKFLVEVCLMRYRDLRADYQKVFEGSNINSNHYLIDGYFDNGDAGSNTRIYGVEMSVDEMIEFMKPRVDIKSLDSFINLLDLNDEDETYRFTEDELRPLRIFLGDEKQNTEIIEKINDIIYNIRDEKGIGLAADIFRIMETVSNNR